MLEIYLVAVAHRAIWGYGVDPPSDTTHCPTLRRDVHSGVDQMPARLVGESQVEFLVNACLVGWVGVPDDIAEIAQRVEELLNGFFGEWFRTGRRR